ncbi:MAG: putative isomerase [Parcubacteria group bacterium]|nr:putative isomerase [Parcubacteria group bacterium]
MNFKDKAFQLLLRNRRTNSLGQTYTVPSPETYPYQWLWDSCFHAIVLAKLDPEAAISELRTILSHQLDDGMIPHIIFWNTKLSRPYNWGWGKGAITSITQPPMVAYAAQAIYHHTRETAFLEELFPRMLSFYKYLIERRDPRDHNLVSIINPDESGEDNSPRFDIPMHLSTDVSFFKHMYERHKLVRANRTCNFDEEMCMKQNFWVKDVPFNVIMIKNLEILAKLALLVKDQKAHEYAKLHAKLMREAMRDLMMEDGVFWATEGENNTHLKVTTWAHFMPLFAELYTPDEAKELIAKHFHDNDSLRSPFGIRTVSKQESSYRAAGFWRGPIWMAPHWFVYKGLREYGFEAEAEWILAASLKLMERNGFREYFNPETGKAYGAHNFTWGTLVLDMMES